MLFHTKQFQPIDLKAWNMIKLFMILLTIDHLVLMCKLVCNSEEELNKHSIEQNNIILQIPNHELDITNYQRKEFQIRGK